MDNKCLNIYIFGSFPGNKEDADKKSRLARDFQTEKGMSCPT